MKSVVDLTQEIKDFFQPQVDSLEETLTKEVTTRATLGAHNLLNTALGTRTTNGITFTRNNDGSIVANGTATADAYDKLDNYVYLPAGTYTLSGCPKGGSASKYMLYAEGPTGISGGIYDYGTTGTNRTFTQSSEFRARLGIVIKSGQTVSNLTFYPMLRLASDPDSTFVPYAKTNQQLTKDDIGLLDNVNKNGCKNLLPMTLSGMKSLNTAGTWSDNVYTKYGVSFEVLTDDSGRVIGINTNGTATSNASFIVAYLPSDLKTFKLNGLVRTSAGDSEYVLAVAVSTGSAFSGRVSNRYNNDDYVVTYTGTDRLKVCIGIGNGYTANNLKFYPMVRLTTDTDPTFAPYAKSNKELTDLTNDIVNTFVEENYGGDNVNVTADGVKTTKTLLNELANALLAKIQSIASDERLMVTMFNFADDIYMPKNSRIIYQNTASSTSPIFFRVGDFDANNNFTIDQIRIHTTLNGNMKKSMKVSTSGNTYTDGTDTVLTSGKNITAHYVIRKLVQ